MMIYRAQPLSQSNHHDTYIGFIDRILVKGEIVGHGFNCRMFNEDFTRLFHSINRRSDNLFKIVSNDDELMQKLLGNVKTRYGSLSAQESIRDLVEEIAQSLVLFGKAYFFLHDVLENEEIHMISLSSCSIVRLFGRHIQLVPKRLKRNWDRGDEVLPREIRILDTSKVMRFDLPSPIKRMLSEQNRKLAVLDKHQFGEANFLAQATHENPNPINHFDFHIWKEIQESAFYRATRKTGWNGRKYNSSKCSDFFDCYRLIRFRKNQLLLRDDILKNLSVELSRVGKGYNTKFSVEIGGTDNLPSVAGLNDLEERLTREEVFFKEIIDYCFKG